MEHYFEMGGKEYLERTIAACELKAGEQTKRAIAEAREVLSDEKFLVQKGIRSLADKDARVGRKSVTAAFMATRWST